VGIFARALCRSAPNNQLYNLWLSPRTPGLTGAECTTLLKAIQSRQQSDGGWSLASLDPRSQFESDGLRRLKQWLKEIATPVATDGYAIGLVAAMLEASGTNRDDAMLRRALECLISTREATVPCALRHSTCSAIRTAALNDL
jgi:hypothetical protein